MYTDIKIDQCCVLRKHLTAIGNEGLNISHLNCIKCLRDIMELYTSWH